MSKVILFNTEAREKLKVGVDIIANAVKVTLGPKGRNVIIEGIYGVNDITKDGVTVAKAISLEDNIENMGAQAIKDVAGKTVDMAGDGTTTASVIAQSIINQGFKMISAGANPMDLKRGIDKAVKMIVDSLKEQSKEVGDDDSKIEQIATISANGDAAIGKLIANAFTKVGREGVISVEASKGTETYADTIEGMQFDRGYISPYFITNNEKMRAELENPFVLIHDKKISTMKEILPILEKVAVANKAILIICEDLDGEALTSLVGNKMKGILKVAVIKTPGFGDNRKEILQDIAILTGGVFFNSEQGMKLEDINLIDLGVADSIRVDKDNTVIIGGQGDPKDISLRITQIKAQIEGTKIDTVKASLQARLAKLAGGVAVLYVGAPTELEMKEKKDRVDDALQATRAAVEEGIIPGGGVAYLRAISPLNYLLGDNEDETSGLAIIRKAVESPIRTILENSGLDGGLIIGKIKEGVRDFGYNARTENYENFFETGVIDPTKVARVALENAASIAGMLLTTECVIANNNKPNN